MLIGGVGNALSANIKSHYNPVTNHCYAEIIVTKNFNSNFPATPNDYRTTSLYDARTVDLLLHAEQQNGKQSGNDFTDETKMSASPYETVLDKIHFLMTQE